jgi:ribosomal-protein-alanine N-acetyltransferase
VTIRPLTLADLPAVLAIESVSFPQPWSEALFRMEINNPQAVHFALEDGGRLAGYLCAGTVLDEMDLRVIAVAPDARRQGHARALVAALLAEARKQGIGYVHLEVRESNEAAKRLYTSLGFRPVGRRKGYYGEPTEDAVLYTAELT